MTWIYLILLFAIVLYLFFLKGVSVVLRKIDSTECDGSIVDVIMDYPRTVLVGLFVFLLMSLFTVRYQIGQMYDCSVRSSVQQVQTQYSWYFDVCQFKNKSGVWIDFKQVRATPDGEEE